MGRRCRPGLGVATGVSTGPTTPVSTGRPTMFTRPVAVIRVRRRST